VKQLQGRIIILGSKTYLTSYTNEAIEYMSLQEQLAGKFSIFLDMWVVLTV
jgi:hypothetical protein